MARGAAGPAAAGRFLREVAAVPGDAVAAVRAARNAPGAALAAVLCMGLAIGACVTAYSTANAFTFHPLPQLGAPGRIVVLAENPQGTVAPQQGVSAALAGTLAREARTLEAIAVGRMGSANVAAAGELDRLPMLRSSANLLAVLGVRPALGRPLREVEVAEGERVALISHAFWQQRFGGVPDVLGRELAVDGAPHRVVGVLPPGFTFPAGAQLWLPLHLPPAAAADPADRSLNAFARLAPGASARAAATELAAVAGRLAAAHPESYADWTIRVTPAEEVYGAGPRPFMMVLLAAVALVLLIGCANVAMLLLVRGTARRREMALRLALGASPGRVLRQWLTEAVVLALAGGALGVLFSTWGIALVARAVPAELHTVISGYDALVVDRRALAFAAGVSVLAGILFGLAPALEAGRMDVRAWLAHSGADAGAGRSGNRLRNGLVVGEVALALMLLVGAGLMMHSFARLVGADPGFRPERLLTMRISLPVDGYEGDAAAADFFRRLAERARAPAAVERAGAVSVLPMGWSEQRLPVARGDAPPEEVERARRVGVRVVSDDYFATLGVPLVRGRGFGRGTGAAGAPPVAMVSASTALRLWGDADPVGRTLTVAGIASALEVVGVVGDVAHNRLVSPDPAEAVYLPLAQRPARSMSLLLRTRGADAAGVTAEIRRIVAELDARVAVGDVHTMARVIAAATSPQRATTGMLAVFAALAALLAGVGIYGVLAFAVAQRQREIGIRLALGAGRAAVLREVLGRALALAAAGTVLGLAGAVTLGQALQGILVETRVIEPAVYLTVTAGVAGLALVAALLPARRAAATDPAAALLERT
jgi:putative ABC transport system permease protein